jgi:hypothetical protein
LLLRLFECLFEFDDDDDDDDEAAIRSSLRCEVVPVKVESFEDEFDLYVWYMR